MKHWRVLIIVIVIAGIILGVYLYGEYLKSQYDRPVLSDNQRIASCISSYTGDDESGWAWEAYGHMPTDEIAKTTDLDQKSGINADNVINSCLNRQF